MKLRIILTGVFALSLAALACGGLDKDAKVKDLSAADLKTLCEDTVEAMGSDKMCSSNGGTVKTKSAEDCAKAASTINCTVGQVESCNDSIGGDVCKVFQSAECLALAACTSTSTKS